VTAIYGALGQVTGKEIDEMGTRLLHRGKQQTTRRLSNELFFGCGTQTGLTSGFFTDGRYTIVADASIYNRDELKESLGSRGCELKTNDSEECLLSMYKVHGITGLNRINGDFGFAIWDQLSRELVLGRDYFGCSPLYYTRLHGGGLAFSSEYKALLALSAVSSVPDLDMIQHLQNCKKLPIGKTLFKDVYSVPPGSIVVLNETGARVRHAEMPKLNLSVSECSEREASQRIKEALIGAIERRIGSQRSIGIAVGGIDSMALVCICRYLYPTAEIHTFTAGYGNRDDDLLNGSRVARAMNTTHHEIKTPPNLLRTSLPKLVWHLEDPYARSESLQLYEVARIASEFVPSLLSAQGADGLFGGMPKYKILPYVTKAAFLKTPLQEFYNLTQIGVKPKSVVGQILDALYFRGTVAAVPKVIGTMYVPDAIAFPESEKEFINQMLISSFQSGVCQSIQKFDRSFAASGVRYLSPFYDRGLVQLAYSIPDSFKIKSGIEKYIFRKALDGIVPKTLLKTPKLPQRMNYDLAFSNTLDEVTDNYLSKSKVEARGFFLFSDIQRLKRRKGTKPYSAEGGMRLWTALLTELWGVEFLDKKGHGNDVSQSRPELELVIESTGIEALVS
jgi:asparagine synthase (glutamine-hydrolysing)